MFAAVWFSQAVSLLGTRMSNFTLGVWVYQETDSVARFTLITAIGLGAGLVASPFLGVLADRWDRRWAMALGTATAGLPLIALILLLAGDRLEVWHVYAAVIVRSVAEAIHMPAYRASITLLVPRGHRGRANGLLELGVNGTRVLAPALAGLLMVEAGPQSVLLFDLLTFLFALAVLVVVRIPQPAPSAGERAAHKTPLRQAAAFGWRYIRARPSLMRLLLFIAGFNAAIGLSLILVTPLVLSFSDVGRLGGVHAIIATGGVLGAVLMSVWGGPSRLMTGILGATLLCGLGLMVGGSRASLWVVACGLFPLSFAIPCVNTCSNTLWQNKVEPALQGRVFAIRTVLAQWTGPFSLLLAGVLADRVFEPLLRPDGALASSLGRLIGVGAGRGMGLMMLLTGLALTAMALAGLGRAELRHLEDELPDATAEASA